MAKKIIVEVDANLGDFNDKIDEAEVKIKGFSEAAIETGAEVGKVGGAIGGVFAVATGAIGAFGDSLGFTSEEIANAQAKASSFVAIMTAVPAIIEGSVAAVQLFNKAIAANPIGALIAGIVALIAIIAGLISIFSSAKTSEETLNDVRKDSIEVIAEEVSTLQTLTMTANNENLSKEARIKAIEELNAISPEYLGNITLETIATEETNAALERYNELINLKAQLDALASLRAEKVKKQLELELELRKGVNRDILDFAAAVVLETDAQKVAEFRQQKKIDAEKEETKALDGLTQEILADIDALDQQAAALNKTTAAETRFTDAIKKSEEELAKLREEQAKEQAKLRDEFIKNTAGLQVELTRALIAAEEDDEKRAIQKLEFDLELDEKRIKALNASSKVRSDLLNQVTENTETEIAEIRERFRIQRADVEANAAAVRKKKRDDEVRAIIASVTNLDALRTSLIQDAFEKQETLEQQSFDMRTLQLDEFLENQIITQAEFNELNAQLTADNVANITAIRQAALDQQDADAQESFDARIGIAETFTTSTNDLAQSVFEISNNLGGQSEEEQERRARKQFQVQKALNLSLAIIDGIKAVQASLAQAPVAIGPLPNPAGIASLAFVAATSAANIVKIASAKFGAASVAGSGGPSAPTSFGAPPEPATPSFDLFGTGQDSEVGPGGTREQPALIKAVVSESDLVATTDRLATIRNSTEL